MPFEYDVPDLLTVVVSSEPAGTVVVLRGELDLSTSQLLGAAIDRACGGEGPVIFDLTELTFMDASGLRLLVQAHRALGERLTLRPAPPQVQRLFVLTGLQDEMPFTSASPPDTVTEHDAHNVRYVRELWAAFRDGGVQALLALVPQAAQWDAYRLSGDSGEEALTRFWRTMTGGARPGESSVATWIEAIGGDVIVRSESPGAGARADVVWSLYVFEGRTLVRAVTFASEAAARRHAVAAHEAG